MSGSRSTAVLEVSGVQWATEKNVAEAVLSRRPGVLGVDANPVAQTATVTYDPERTSVAEPEALLPASVARCRASLRSNATCSPRDAAYVDT